MRRSDDELLKVPESEYGSLTQDELLRLVVISRNRPGRATRKKARKAWQTLIASDFDRVRNIVVTFRFPEEPTVTVHRDNVDDAVQYAFERLMKMLGTFEGTALHSFRAAMRRCVNYACMDHCRAEMARDKRAAGSLDEEVYDAEGGSRGRFEATVVKRERKRIQEEEADEDELARLLEVNGRIEEAIAQLEGDQRAVIEMTRAGNTTEEIMSHLGTSRANVYKVRERGLKRVREILDGDGQS
jgi:RNA polymerase sigma factor (sigma-70 family)